MINEIKRPIVKDLKPKTNTTLNGVPLEKYIPGEPLKRSAKHREEVPTNQAKAAAAPGLLSLSAIFRDVSFIAQLFIIMAAVKYLFFDK